VANDGARRLVIGLVHGLHGLRGAIRVEVLTDDEDIQKAIADLAEAVFP